MKNYEDLTFADSYMFYRILRENKDICIGLIERLLSIRVKDIKYLTAEADINFGYDSKGIRLDVYLEDEDCVFDLELQTYSEGDLPKRMRYYQAMIDIDHLDRAIPCLPTALPQENLSRFSCVPMFSNLRKATA